MGRRSNPAIPGLEAGIARGSIISVEKMKEASPSSAPSNGGDRHFVEMKCDRHGLERCVLCSLAVSIGNVSAIRLKRDVGTSNCSASSIAPKIELTQKQPASVLAAGTLPSLDPAANTNPFLSRLAAKSFADSTASRGARNGGGPCERHGLDKCVLCSSMLPSISAVTRTQSPESEGLAQSLKSYAGTGSTGSTVPGIVSVADGNSAGRRELKTGPCARHGLEGCFLCSLSTGPVNVGFANLQDAGVPSAPPESSGAVAFNDTPVDVLGAAPSSVSSGFKAHREGSSVHNDDDDTEADEEEYRRVSVAEAERRGETYPYAELRPSAPSPYLAPPPGSTASEAVSRSRQHRSGKPLNASKSQRRSQAADTAESTRSGVRASTEGLGSALSWSLQRPGPGSSGHGGGSGMRYSSDAGDTLVDSAPLSRVEVNGPSPLFSNGDLATEALRAAHSILTEGPSRTELFSFSARLETRQQRHIRTAVGLCLKSITWYYHWMDFESIRPVL